MSDKVKAYLHQLGIGIDQLANTLTGGWADETLSARVYRHVLQNTPPSLRWRVLHKVIDGLFFWQHEHCKRAFINESQRTQLPRVYREIK